MIEVKYILPHRHIVKEEQRKKERVGEEGSEENQRSCCIRQDKGTNAAYEDQKDD
jgi:hypothetical protein